MDKSYFEVLKWASSFLETQGKEGYSIQYVFQERKGWSKTDWLLHMRETMPSEEQKQLQSDLKLLTQDYPPQYLLGYSDFYGLRLKVNRHTLIPRPETEELVESCLSENENRNMIVADVGTGSGAIALSLKAARPDWLISSIDISEDALEVAEENAEKLQLAVEFIYGNGLQPFIQANKKIDLLISNPPYISYDEWQLMDSSVREFEPKQALFAEENGLALYRQLAGEAKKVLNSAGKIYLEIGFQQGPAVKEIMEQAFPEKRIRILKDLSNNDRMIVVD